MAVHAFSCDPQSRLKPSIYLGGYEMNVCCCCRFSEFVKVKSICVIGANDDTAPAELKMYNQAHYCWLCVADIWCDWQFRQQGRYRLPER